MVTPYSDSDSFLVTGVHITIPCGSNIHVNREAQLDYKLDYKSHDEEHYKDQNRQNNLLCTFLIDESILY